MVDGTARLIEPHKRQAKLGVVFPNVRFSRPVPADGNYWVLDTDYTNYSLVWSCETFNSKSFRKSNAIPMFTLLNCNKSQLILLFFSLVWTSFFFFI